MELPQDLLAAIERLHGGARDEGRAALEAVWARLDPDDHVLRCIAAHYLADAHDDPADELAWDQRALAAATRGSAAELASFLPSLHLNLAADHERLGDLASARVHAVAARQATSALPVTDLGALTGAAIERICRRLGV